MLNSLPSEFILNLIVTEHLLREDGSYKEIKACEGMQSIYILVGEGWPNTLTVVTDTFDDISGCHGNGYA